MSQIYCEAIIFYTSYGYKTRGRNLSTLQP